MNMEILQKILEYEAEKHPVATISHAKLLKKMLG